MPLNARRYLVAVDRAEMQPGQRVPLHAAAEAAEILTGHAKVDHRWIRRARGALVANETHVRDAIAQAEAQVRQRVDGDRRRGFEEEELGAILEAARAVVVRCSGGSDWIQAHAEHDHLLN